jgi:hypothetical protein
MLDQVASQRISDLLAEVKRIAVEYYSLTKKPLGVTGEVAEHVASQLLGLELEPARTQGYDATRGGVKIQIKGRALGKDSKAGQRMGTIKQDADCDVVMLVLLSIETLDAQEIWEAPFTSVKTRLANSTSKAHARGSLGIREFKRLEGAAKIWPKRLAGIPIFRCRYSGADIPVPIFRCNSGDRCNNHQTCLLPKHKRSPFPPPNSMI